MTLALAVGPSKDQEEPQGLEREAKALAKQQQDLKRSARLIPPLFEGTPVARRLEQAQRYLGSHPGASPALKTAAEWFLDNYYLIRRVARQVEEELPHGFRRHLPQLASGEAQGRPRIDALSRGLIASTELVIDWNVLGRFIDAYQEVSPLTIAELWALPTMLRSAALQHLLHFLVELEVPIQEGDHLPAPLRRWADEEAVVQPISLAPGAGVERTIRALRVLDAIDWKAFFQRSNRVEATLLSDPAQVYARMDFQTCDTYRKVVENLAWTTGSREEDVAGAAVALAQAAFPDHRRGHVGYYLIAEGRAALEEQLGYRPVGMERVRRWVLRWPTAAYLLPLALLSALPLSAAALYLSGTAHSWGALALLMIIALVPCSGVAVAVLHYAFAHLLPPHTRPKLDLRKGLPTDARTLVVIPTLLGRAADVTAMIRQLELHYLCNPDPSLQFAILTDDVDAKAEQRSLADRELLDSAAQGIMGLNKKHGDAAGGPFHLLHRAHHWNGAEERYMGWERKRGKLEELNRLLRGDQATSYTLHIGNPQGLLDIRFVITLDSDTELPMGSVERLVGLLAHPLNKAVFDPETGRVVAGYTIVQPRIETSPSGARRTLFSRIFAGDVGFDIYTHASSELYQDLFGAGIYVGKGIYDVDAFMRSVEGRVPENALVSHDLFEGVHGRTALATDIVLFEHYPESYATYALRMHRWIRGDWQLLPWLFRLVPFASGVRSANTLARIDRWKIADNLRRSLSGPTTLLLLLLAWTGALGSAVPWTLGILALFVAPSLPSLLGGPRMRAENLARVGLSLAFLPYESLVVVDAIARVIVRKIFTRKHLLQWTSAAHAAFGIAAQSPRAVFWRTMISSPLLAAAVGLALAELNPAALYAAGPLLLLWCLAPELARWLSAPSASRTHPITEHERHRLRLLARRTWRFFDVFVGPNDQWLPIDNHQEEPREQTAHRTSPTNIGLTLLATLSAYDFGYVGPSELTLRIRRAFDSIARLAHYQGHLLNWYDTRNLQPLLPRYVSTVDSGNFAGCLLALKQGCREVQSAPVIRAEPWEGLRDSIDLLEEVLLSAPQETAESLRSVLARMQEAAGRGQRELGTAYQTLHQLCEVTLGELDRELLAFLESGPHKHEPDLLRALRTSIDRLHQQLRQMRREVDGLLPWLALMGEPAAQGLGLPTELRLDQIAVVAAERRHALDLRESDRQRSGPASLELDASAKRLTEALRTAESNASTLLAELQALAALADEEVLRMDFKLLYDGERRLFHIGYNATIDELDPHYYDLLASEARLASYLAIVKRDVPESHWHALGRPMTSLRGTPALLSWGGTMFEYLMPNLLMQSHEGTLLAQTTGAVVDAQIAYGKRCGDPWGVSESAYARVDADQTYQYRSFGVPGLGFKRGLEEDRVITPYASMLAVSLRPRAVLDNLRLLEARGMLGTYGLFEALDLTPGRTLPHRSAQDGAVVRSYMAHHQGMLLIALGNLLNPRSMVRRFHADALVKTGEVLLNERAPDRAPAEWPLAEEPAELDALATPPPPPAPASWTPLHPSAPSAFVLSNGRLSSVVTGSGGGGLRWGSLALTRFEVDGNRDEDGLWLFLRDDDTGHLWTATSSEGRTCYSMHKVEFHERREGVSVHVDVAVAAADDVEVRQVTLHNETNRARRLSVTSAGRPVLLDPAQAASHPAFASLFVESERVTELDGLLFLRRAQRSEELPAVLVHRLVREGSDVHFEDFETERGQLYGRAGSWDQPRLAPDLRDPSRVRVGAMLDPVMSITASVELPAKGSVSFAFVTTVGRSRATALELAKKYGSMHAVRWAFRDAELESPRRLQRAKVEPGLMPTIQRLYTALLFAEPSLRALPSARAATPPSQRRLWVRGISGDHPIVLIKVENAEAPLLREALCCQRYLRAAGVRIDLVLIDELATGYVTEGPGTLRNVLVLNEADDWLNRHGGVFVIPADHVPEEELRHLEACSRLVLSTKDGTLSSRLSRPVESPPRLPKFEATAADVAAPRALAPLTLQFDQGLGGFSPDGREYVIELSPGRPTPAPWCNVLTNPEFGCLVSESSLGMSWSQNSGENRLTPWRNDPVFDRPSEVLYLRDEETAAVWSPTPLPAGQAERTRVRHGAGYTSYEQSGHGLVQELTVFVPPDAALKIVRLRVRNTLPRRRRLTATYYAEWVLGSRREAQRPHIVSELAGDKACLLARCDWNAEFAGRVAFLASREKIHGFTTDRSEFLGRRGDYARPEALERWGLSGRVDLGADPCAALQVHLELAPGATLETHFILGQAVDRNEALQVVERYLEPAAVETAWLGLRAYWDQLLDQVVVKTPEPSMDLMLNRWLLYQTLSARVFGRTGYYQSSGAFGYRDQLQDVLAVLHSAPAIARAHILEAAKHQFLAGDVLHWWHPPSGRGVRTRCSDDLAWLPYVTAEYVRATGDVAILEEPVSFLAGEPLRPDERDRYAQYDPAPGSAPLFVHCQRALEKALTKGGHGLPLMGDGDWNDGMSRVGSEGRGESVWLGWFLCATMLRFATLCERRGDPASASEWRGRAQALRATIQEVAWDGDWYVRAYHDDGAALGSTKRRECRIDSIAQSWAVLSTERDPRDEPRSVQAVREADDQLVKSAERLVLLFWPPFDSTVHDPGYVRAYPPGVRENGGQYTHAATWLGLAHAALKDGARAERVFRLLNPILRTQNASEVARYRVEPYSLAGDIYSCAPWVGRGGWTWYSGSAAWMWRLGVEGILGLRRVQGGLHIDPCIPPSWPGFEAWVRLGEQEIHVVVENPEHVSTGVRSLSLDRRELDSCWLALDPGAKGRAELRVRLGAGAPPMLLKTPSLGRTELLPP